MFCLHFVQRCLLFCTDAVRDIIGLLKVRPESPCSWATDVSHLKKLSQLLGGCILQLSLW